MKVKSIIKCPKGVSKCILSVFLILMQALPAQTPPELKVLVSPDFSSPFGFVLKSPLDVKDGYIQTSSKDNDELFCFQKFSKDLKLQKTNTVSIKDRLNAKNKYERFIQTKNKIYLLTREVHNEEHTEGVSALEFFPDQLELSANSVSLFQSSDKVAVNRGTYDYFLSGDKTKLLITYRMVPKIRSSNSNKDMIGMFVFDEKLKKLWGDEFEMPYPELMMQIIDYTVSTDGKIFMTIKVFENDSRDDAERDGSISNHLELLVFEKNKKKPTKIEIGLQHNFYKNAYVFEDGNKKLCVAGLYSSVNSVEVNGVYMATFPLEKWNFSEDNPVKKTEAILYGIPTAICESANSAMSINSTNTLNRLQLRDIELMEDGSIKILTEEFRAKFNTIIKKMDGFDPYTYNYYKGYQFDPPHMTHAYSGDIYIFSIDKNERLEWVKRIPKYQHRSDGDYRPLSFSTLVFEDNLYVFFLDTKKNDNIQETGRAKQYHGRSKYGYLRGVSIDKQGNTRKFDAGYRKIRAIDFFIRFFKAGNNNNLYFVERTARNNVLYVIQPD